MIDQLQSSIGIKKPLGLIFRNIIKLLVLLLFISSCGQDTGTKEIEGVVFTGETQGTTYTIILAEEKANFTQEEITELLRSFDLSLSTYVDSSVISKLNNSDNASSIIDPTNYFRDCYLLSKDVFERSAGAFDPSVFPLVEGWGFMKDLKTPLSDSKVDSILQFVSFEKNKLHVIEFKGDTVILTKKDKRFKLDFNGIAQGQSVDVLDRFISSRGHKNYYVEIGGEMVVKGKNRENLPWKIGIDVPKENTKSEVRQLENVLSVSNRAIATSGNYRKFYIKDGKKYAHTLDPRTGFPVEHSLLSATVISDNCAISDAYATVFMVIGLEETKKFLEKNQDLGLEVYLLFDQNGEIRRYYSPSAERYLD